MQLERIGAVVRPRNAWESIDLGFILVRQWWLPLLRVWLGLLLPLALVLFALSEYFGLSWLTGLLLWWLKPLLDRVLLFFFSHALFGEYPSLRASFRALPGLFKTRLWHGLTLGRFDTLRSFRLPVWQLEGLSGKAAQQRVALLQKHTGNYASWLTLACLHLDWVLYLSLFMLMYLFTPITYEINWGALFFASDDLATPLWFNLLDLLFSLIALSLIEPLYVAAGFALYLNRRTHLEGWDIELAFRRLAGRLQQNGGALLLPLLVGLALALGGAALPQTVYAATAEVRAEGGSAAEHLRAVLAEPEFATSREEWFWRAKNQTNTDPNLGDWFEHSLRGLNWLVTGLAQSLEFILWGVLGFGLAWLLWYARAYLPALSVRLGARPPPPIPAETVFGLNPPSSLEGDLAARALALCRQGQTLAALSLLYRGALRVLQERHGLRLEAGSTEGDCLRLARRALAGEQAGYFAQLTRAWQYAAYARHGLEAAEIELLCQSWPRHFGVEP